MSSELLGKAKNRADQLERTTKYVWIIAILVYIVMSFIAVYNQAWIAIVFFTCLMLGVRVVYLLVQTSLSHFEIIRSRE